MAKRISRAFLPEAFREPATCVILFKTDFRHGARGIKAGNLGVAIRRVRESNEPCHFSPFPVPLPAGLPADTGKRDFGDFIRETADLRARPMTGENEREMEDDEYYAEIINETKRRAALRDPFFRLFFRGLSFQRETSLIPVCTPLDNGIRGNITRNRICHWRTHGPLSGYADEDGEVSTRRGTANKIKGEANTRVFVKPR